MAGDQRDASRTFTLWGDQMTVKLGGAETGGRLAMLELVTAAGSGVSLHAHNDADETFYVLEGTLSFQVAHQKTQVSAGSSIFAPRGVRHTFVNSKPTVARLLIVITPSGLEKFFEELGEMAQAHPHGPPNREFFALAKKHNVELL